MHYGYDFTALKKELTAFRTKVTARRINELGMSNLQIADLLNEEVYIPKEAKGL